MAKKRGTEKSPNKQILSRTLVLMGVCGILTFVILGAKLFQIQIIQHEDYEQRAIEQQVRETTVNASRGTIYDSTGTILAKSASVENVFISPAAIYTYEEDQELIASGLSQILDVDKDSILDKMGDRTSYYQTIKTKLEKEEADQVREFINTYELKSIYLEPATKRYYPKESTAAHVLGFVGADETGMGYGVEGSYDDYLTGEDGRIVRLKSSSGTDMLNMNYEDYYASQAGDDVHLTVDINIQQIMEKHLEQAIADYDAQEGGFALAMNPQTGEILGMVSMDGYNPNSYSEVDEETKAALLAESEDEDEYLEKLSELLGERWRNKTLSYTYEPGSTFKLITLAIALEEGIVSLDDTFYCGGSMHVMGRTSALNCWKSGGHGLQTLTEAIQHSCNVATATIGLDIGADIYYDYLEAFGFLEEAGIDMAGEQLGYIWPRSDWDQYIANDNYSSLAAASFGQTFNISPLQLVTAISALSNGGYLMQPYIVDKVVSTDGTVTAENTPTVRRQVISEETSQIVLEIMEAVVGDDTEGTGKNAAVAGYRIGGKTGTSTDTVQEAQDDVKEYIVSFVGVAPIEDPQIVLLVALQSPSKETGIYISGGQMAAPTVGNMLSEILPYMGIEASGDIEAQINTVVPYVERMGAEEARAELEAEGFAVIFEGEGDQVTDQMPAAGANVAAGTQVIVYLGEEKPEENVTVPDVVGMTYATAKETLQSYGLYVRRSGTTAEGGAVQVYKQSVEAGEVVPRGTVIEVSLIDTDNVGEY